MKTVFGLSLLLIFISCSKKQCGDRYIKISESSKIEPKFNEKYGVLSQEVVVLIDCVTNEFIYFDVWNEKIINRIPIK
jgi:hypothetical protein